MRRSKAIINPIWNRNRSKKKLCLPFEYVFREEKYLKRHSHQFKQICLKTVLMVELARAGT
jgi:hypothetical protein